MYVNPLAMMCLRGSSWRSFASSTTSRSKGLPPDLGDLSPSTQDLYHGLLSGDRGCLARSITLVESSKRSHALEARKLMTLVEKHLRTKEEEHGIDGGRSGLQGFRLGLSGPPGAGKSTFIEAFGRSLTARGNKVAVLAVDPSSGTTGGSLLGDKTRMHELTRDPNAYIRPSPNRGHLGGVTRSTNEAIALCEACGYNHVIVETVGVGQSEYIVADMVDMFCLLIPPAGGDELQGIKRGIVEQSDLIIINKCDGDLVPAARRIKAEYTSALKFMRKKSVHWKPKVKMMSSKTGDGLEEVSEVMSKFREVMTEAGELETKRALQRKKWMWSYINDRLIEIFTSDPGIRSRSHLYEGQVINYQLSPGTAADILIEQFLKTQKATKS